MGVSLDYLTGISDLQLDQELRETRQELDRYRNSVVEHFTTTAQLVNKLVDR